jgi:hypothetical protein
MERSAAWSSTRLSTWAITVFNIYKWFIQKYIRQVWK